MKKLIMLLPILVLFACNRETQCPAFPEKDLTFIPQKKGDLLKFTNTRNDTLIFTVKDNWVSESYTQRNNCGCNCSSQAGFETETNEKYALSIKEEIYAEENPTRLFCSFKSEGTDEDQFFLTNTFATEMYIYEDNNNRIQKIGIENGKGIVEFFDKKENCTWTRIE